VGIDETELMRAALASFPRTFVDRDVTERIGAERYAPTLSGQLSARNSGSGIGRPGWGPSISGVQSSGTEAGTLTR